MTRVTLAAFAIPILVHVGVHAQSNLPEDLARARDQFVSSSAKADKTVSSTLVTDDLLWVQPSGRVRDKATWLQELVPNTGKNVSADARQYRGGTIVVSHRRGADAETRIFQVWLRQGNQWKLAMFHAVPVGEYRGTAAVPASVRLPPNSGPAADVKAIETAVATLSAGNQRADAQNFASLVTDQFVAVTASGVSSKQDRMAAISKTKPTPPAEPKIEQSSTRIYGDMAITNRIYQGDSGRVATTIVHVRDSGQWLRAGIAITPISSAKPAPPSK